MKGKMQRQSDCQKSYLFLKELQQIWREKKLEDIRYKYRRIFSQYMAEIRQKLNSFSPSHRHIQTDYTSPTLQRSFP